MSKDPLEDRLREVNWRRSLTAAEQEQLRVWLVTHPETSADWEVETRLTEALRRLPEAPVPSNFTARVLQAVEQEEAQAGHGPGEIRWSWRLPARWLPRAALAGVMLAAGLLTYQNARDTRRKEMAESVREVVGASLVPGPEILQDFDAIQVMSQSPKADVALLKALE